MSVDDETAGYKRPPKSSRFKKRVSGNPKGRKPGRHREVPYEAILGQMMTMLIDGVQTTISAEEVFLRKLLNDATKGNSTAAIQFLAIMEEEKRRQDREEELQGPHHLDINPIPRGCVAHHLRDLGILWKFDRFRETAYFRIEPKAVEAALERLGDRRLTVEEQHIIFDATRTPNKVNWPDWWEVLP